jgi:hypothetical protein
VTAGALGPQTAAVVAGAFLEAHGGRLAFERPEAGGTLARAILPPACPVGVP